MWKHPLFAAPAKKSEAMPSVRKRMQLSFCTIKVSLWILLTVVTLTADRYCGTLRGYGRPFVAKISGLLCQCVIILHNARLHIANLTCKALWLCGYGPSSLLSQSYAEWFPSFCPLKNHLGGKLWHTASILHQHLLHQDTSLGAMKGQTLKCRWRLYGVWSLPSATYMPSKSE